MALTDNQRRFCEEYILDLNATQAAIRAGYAAATANKTGPRLLVNVGVQAEIQRLIDERSKRTEITADRVLRELARLAFSDPRTMYREDGTLKSPAEWDDDTAAAVASVESEEERESSRDGEPSTVTTTRKVKRWDKKGSLELLGKHLGLFAERHEHTGKDGGPIQLTTEQRAEAVAGILAQAAARLKTQQGAGDGVDADGAD